MNTPVFTVIDPALLKKCSNKDLHQKLTHTSEKERQLTAQMIALIEEADRRRLYYDYGHKSMFDYLTIELKYSAGAAMRRLDCARLSREIPEVKEKVVEGTLTLSSLARAQQYFKTEKSLNNLIPTEIKKEVIQKLEGQSTRETERTLASLSSQPERFLKPDRIQPLTSELSQISFQADQELLTLFEEAKGLLAHRMPEATLGEIITELVKIGVAVLRNKKFKTRSEKGQKVGQQPKSTSDARTDDSTQGPSDTRSVDKNNFAGTAHEVQRTASAGTVIGSNGDKSNEESKILRVRHTDQNSYIPADVKRTVSERDENKCAVIDPKTGQRCGSYRQIEFDHYPIPKAMGGPSAVENLRLACRACNLRYGVQKFGKAKVF